MRRDFLHDELVQGIILEGVHIHKHDHAILIVHHMEHDEARRKTRGVLTQSGGFNAHHSVIGCGIVHEERGRMGVVGIAEGNEMVRFVTPEEGRIFVVYSE